MRKPRRRGNSHAAAFSLPGLVRCSRMWFSASFSMSCPADAQAVVPRRCCQRARLAIKAKAMANPCGIAQRRAIHRVVECKHPFFVQIELFGAFSIDIPTESRSIGLHSFNCRLVFFQRNHIDFGMGLPERIHHRGTNYDGGIRQEFSLFGHVALCRMEQRDASFLFVIVAAQD